MNTFSGAPKGGLFCSEKAVIRDILERFSFPALFSSGKYSSLMGKKSCVKKQGLRKSASSEKVISLIGFIIKAL